MTTRPPPRRGPTSRRNLPPWPRRARSPPSTGRLAATAIPAPRRTGRRRPVACSRALQRPSLCAASSTSSGPPWTPGTSRDGSPAISPRPPSPRPPCCRPCCPPPPHIARPRHPPQGIFSLVTRRLARCRRASSRSRRLAPQSRCFDVSCRTSRVSCPSASTASLAIVSSAPGYSRRIGGQPYAAPDLDPRHSGRPPPRHLWSKHSLDRPVAGAVHLHHAPVIEYKARIVVRGDQQPHTNLAASACTLAPRTFRLLWQLPAILT